MDRQEAKLALIDAGFEHGESHTLALMLMNLPIEIDDLSHLTQTVINYRDDHIGAFVEYAMSHMGSEEMSGTEYAMLYKKLLTLKDNYIKSRK